ncbi:MAG: exonuclease SbcCD subunit D [Nitrososphaerota archaeon]|nr:exonuclease SbcCD subunit D [Nitrososphaerota archaeon]
MLIGHLSDSHLGARPYGLREREEDFYEAFHEAIGVMVERGVSAIIHAGDVFDTPTPDGTALVKMVRELKMLNERGIRFYFTMGEHDISRRYVTPTSFLYPEMNLATYIGDGEPLSRDGLTIVGFHKYRRLEANDLRARLRTLDDRIASMGGKKVLVLHQGLVEFNEYAGEISSSDLPKSFDYYAMGHLHDMAERRFDGIRGPVCYPGSLDSTSVEGIRDHRKGFYLVELSGDEAKPEWVELKSLRKHINVEVSYGDLEGRVEELMGQITGLKKKPLVHFKIVGAGAPDVGTTAGSSHIVNALGRLQRYTIYQDWELVEGDADRPAGMDYQEKPQDVDHEMRAIAGRVLGSDERAAFAIDELMPRLVAGRVDEAIESLWSAYQGGRLKPAGPVKGPPTPASADAGGRRPSGAARRARAKGGL